MGFPDQRNPAQPQAPSLASDLEDQNERIRSATRRIEAVIQNLHGSTVHEVAAQGGEAPRTARALRRHLDDSANLMCSLEEALTRLEAGL